jgi:hypothetical protein
MFELHLKIWKREDGLSKISEYLLYEKKTAKQVYRKYGNFLPGRKSAS